ncbi:MAG: hypothetical protein K8W52_08335 [Deltaproteobacteria bacterium]|nr:hypothetical protein [Deltaproteobacteria bacterium]
MGHHTHEERRRLTGARAPRLAAIMLAALALTACSKPVPAPDEMDPVSLDEAKAVAAAFKAAYVPCDPARVDALLDFESLVRRAIQRVEAPDDLRRGIAEGARAKGGAGQMLCAGVTADSTYDLLRIKDVHGQPRPLLRIISNSAVNYHELELGKSRTDHRVRIVDIQIYTSGDRLSDTLAQLFQQGVAVVEDGDGDGMDTKMHEASQAAARGDHATVRRLMRELPAKLRNTKAMRMMDLMSAGSLDPVDYDAAMEQYRRDFPGDPSVEMMSIDYYYLKKDIAKTVAALDHLDQQVGGDPYLAVMRASAYLIDQEPEHLAAAEQWARKATEGMPDNKNAWWTLAAVLLVRKDYAAVVPVVATLRGRFSEKIDPQTMAKNELWTGFFASPASKDSPRSP